MRHFYKTVGHNDINLEIVIDPYIHDIAKLSRQEFLDRVSNIKGIRTKEIEFSFFLDDIKNLERLVNLHKIINDGDFSKQIISKNYLFAIGIPSKLYLWLKNINSSTLHKQLLHWHAAYYAFNSFQEFADEEFDPLVLLEIKKILNKYYPLDYKEKFNLDDIDNNEEFDLKEAIALQHYFSVSEKYTGSLPPEFLKNPYRDPDSNLSDDDFDWGIFPGCKYSILISYFNILDWMIIIEKSIDKLKEFHKISIERKSITIKDLENIIAKGEYDTLERAESNSENWQKWKYTFENFEIRKNFTYSLIPKEKTSSGFIYLFQTLSKEATKIGWTTKPSEHRKIGVQTGNHEQLIERGHFKASSKKTEDVLHEMFKEKQTRESGEWFYLSEDEINNILNPEWRMRNNIF